MNDSKVFYVNYETGRVASDADSICNDISCSNCPYEHESECGGKYHADPESFIKACGYVAVPFSLLSGAHCDESAASEEKHYVIFPTVERSMVYALSENQYNLVRRLQSMGACEYDDVDIDTL